MDKFANIRSISFQFATVPQHVASFMTKSSNAALAGDSHRADRTRQGRWTEWVLGTAGAMNRELRTRCMLKMQNAEETKKIAITIWHRRKTCEEKNLWNVSVFVFLVFVHCKKIQIKRKMCKLLWMVCHSNLRFAMTSHTLWGKNCMLTACRVSASRATHLPI